MATSGRDKGFAPEDSGPRPESDGRSPYALPIWRESGRLVAHSVPSWNQIRLRAKTVQGTGRVRDQPETTKISGSDTSDRNLR